MKGCPFNNFGPCREDECMFFLSQEHTHKIMSRYTGIPEAGKNATGRNLCSLWHVFVAAQDSLFHFGRAFRSVPADHPLKETPVLALISDIQQKLESLEKELKKS